MFYIAFWKIPNIQDIIKKHLLTVGLGQLESGFSWSFGILNIFFCHISLGTAFFSPISDIQSPHLLPSKFVHLKKADKIDMLMPSNICYN